MRKPDFRAAALAAATLAALVLPGCGSSFSTYCNAQQQCAGGNSKDVSACEDETQGEINAANDYGCGQAASDFTTCINQKYSCTTGASACAAEAASMAACECAASANCDRTCPTSCAANPSTCCSAGVSGCC